MQDGWLLTKVGVAATAAWLVPERLWMPLGRVIGRAQAGVRTAASLDVSLAAATGRSARSLAIERTASGHASRLWGLREYVRPRRDPPTDLVGMSHLACALAGKRGAILWVGRFTWASIMTKIALHRAGCAVIHLSRPTHGFGTSLFAVRRLNPVWTRIEERFVRERIVMEPGSETAALRALHRHLEANAVVSITVGDEGVRVVSVPFLGGILRLASGPASLAAASGAPLLPVFTVADGTGRFRIEIEPALQCPAGDSRERREQRVAEGYAARLEPWVRHYPGQWLG